MKKFLLSALSLLAILPSAALADNYICPTAQEAQQLVRDKATTWQGWNITGRGPAITDDATFLFVTAPSKDSQRGGNQTEFAVGCDYTPTPNSPAVPGFINLSHGNMDTFKGVQGNWVTGTNQWLTCYSSDATQCVFANN